MEKEFDKAVILVQLPLPKPNVEVAIFPFEPNWDDDDTDFDLMKILSELEDGKLDQLQPRPQGTNTISQSLMHQPNSPMFSGCRIGNITTSIQKK